MSRSKADNIDKFHDYSIYLPNRLLFMGNEENSLEHGESGTDGAMAERMLKNLAILDTMSQDPITIIMNNIGGDFMNGMAIYDAISACESEIIIKAYGNAMSMGSIIFQAADKRIMAPNAVQMIHYGTWSFSGHAKTGYKWANDNKRLDEWMENMYLTRIQEKQPGFKIKALEKMLDHDTFLTARESVDLGLADAILGEESE